MEPPASAPRVPLSQQPTISTTRRLTTFAAAAANVSSAPVTFALPDPFHTKRKALNHIVAQTVFCNHHANHIYNPATGKQETVDTLINGPKATIWRWALSNELGRLADGINGCINGTNTIAFIHKHEVPTGKKVTYANMVCDH